MGNCCLGLWPLFLPVVIAMIMSLDNLLAAYLTPAPASIKTQKIHKYPYRNEYNKIYKLSSVFFSYLVICFKNKEFTRSTADRVIVRVWKPKTSIFSHLSIFPRRESSLNQGDVLKRVHLMKQLNSFSPHINIFNSIGQSNWKALQMTLKSQGQVNWAGTYLQL